MDGSGSPSSAGTFDPVSKYTFYSSSRNTIVQDPGLACSLDAFFRGNTDISLAAGDFFWLDIAKPSSRDILFLHGVFLFSPLELDALLWMLSPGQFLLDRMASFPALTLLSMSAFDSSYFEPWHASPASPDRPVSKKLDARFRLFLLYPKDRNCAVTFRWSSLPFLYSFAAVLASKHRDPPLTCSVFISEFIRSSSLDPLEGHLHALEDDVFSFSGRDEKHPLLSLNAARRRLGYLEGFVRSHEKIYSRYCQRTAEDPGQLASRCSLARKIVSSNLDIWMREAERAILEASYRRDARLLSLSRLATLSLPLSLLVGLCSMNIPLPLVSPATQSRAPFVGMVLLLLAVSLVSLAYVQNLSCAAPEIRDANPSRSWGE